MTRGEARRADVARCLVLEGVGGKAWVWGRSGMGVGVSAREVDGGEVGGLWCWGDGVS